MLELFQIFRKIQCTLWKCIDSPDLNGLGAHLEQFQTRINLHFVGPVASTAKLWEKVCKQKSSAIIKGEESLR